MQSKPFQQEPLFGREIPQRHLFHHSRSTAFQTAQARQRVLEAKLAESRALSGQRSALVELFRRDGSLPERRSIELPVPEQ